MSSKKIKLLVSFNTSKAVSKNILDNISIQYLEDVFYHCIEIWWFFNSSLTNKIIYLNFVSDKEIQQINKKSRNKDCATDCLSLPYEPNDFIEEFWDIFIAFPYIEKQAEEYKVSLKQEIVKMFIHSMLHLFWFDHIGDKDYKIMKEKEEEVLKKIK